MDKQKLTEMVKRLVSSDKRKSFLLAQINESELNDQLVELVLAEIEKSLGDEVALLKVRKNELDCLNREVEDLSQHEKSFWWALYQKVVSALEEMVANFKSSTKNSVLAFESSLKQAAVKKDQDQIDQIRKKLRG